VWIKVTFSGFVFVPNIDGGSIQAHSTFGLVVTESETGSLKHIIGELLDIDKIGRGLIVTETGLDADAHPPVFTVKLPAS
jgi:hypothetical protein